MRKEVSFFNETSSSYDKEYARETPEGYSFRIRRERVLELLPTGTKKQFLDIASGPGVMVEGVLAKGYTIECVDAAPDMIEIARTKYAGQAGATFSVGDVYALPHTNGQFDVVCAMGLVEYLDDQNKAMEEIARVAKHEGVVIVTFPNRPSLWRSWARLLRTITQLPRTFFKKLTGKKPYPITHREYTEHEATRYMKRHGLVPDSVVYYNFKVVPYPFDRWFPRFTVWQSKVLENPQSPLRRLCATAFIVRARKR